MNASDLPEPFDVVAVGAHPDDVEVTCGGTLARLARQGYRVGIIDLTDGEPTPACPAPEVRRAEAQRAAAVLGVAERVILDLPNRKLFDNYDSRVALARQLRRWRPRMILGFGDRTPLASPDHWQAVQITEAAVFYARLTKWDDVFDGLPVHAVERLVYFTSIFEPVKHPSPYGYVVTDISETLTQKMESIRCYQTQFPPAKANVLKHVEAAAIQVGTSAGFEAGECFVPTRPLGTSDLFQTLLP